MRKKRITKNHMAETMKISRAQLDCILEPNNGGAAIENLLRAASLVNNQLKLELVQVPKPIRSAASV